MKRLIFLLFISTFTIAIYGAQRIDTIGNSINPSSFSYTNTRYIINKYTVAVNSAPIYIGKNSVLVFQGGSISGANLHFNNTYIEAPNVKVFETNCSFSGQIVNPVIPVNWFAAIGDGTTDDSNAINKALTASSGSIVELDNRSYMVKSTIHVKDYQKFRCIGEIITDQDINVIDFEGINLEVDINKIRQTSVELFNDSSDTFLGTAMLFNKYCENSRFKIGQIWGFDKGICFKPRKTATTAYAGSQYLQFNFNFIWSRYCVYIDMVTDIDGYSDNPLINGSDLWMNENIFSGGRLRGRYGVYVKKNENEQPINWDWINGLVFNHIGFEGLRVPITLYHAFLCNFNDVRMSESIFGDYLDLEDCKYINFRIKSLLPYDKVKHKKCMQIKFENPAVDAGFDYQRRLNYYMIDNLNSLNDGEDIELLGHDNFEINMERQIFHNSDYPAPDSVSLDYFLADKYNGPKLLSTFCKVMLYNYEVLNVFVKNSASRLLATEMLLNCEFGENSSIVFHFEDNSVQTISNSGIYRLVYSRDNELRIVKISE